MAEYAAMDMQWYEEARMAVLYYRQGQQAREGAEKDRSKLRAVN
jgi:hypothetical protein